MKLGAIGAGEAGKELPLCRGTLSFEGEDNRLSPAASSRSGAMKPTSTEPFGEGQAEVADVTGGLSYLEGLPGGRPKLFAVAGYSFGSYVGAMTSAVADRVGFYLGIAPPLNRYDFGFLRQALCRMALIGAT